MPAPSPTETLEQREARIRREAELIAQGEADYEAGLVYDLEDVLAWLDARETDPNAPEPPLLRDKLAS